MTPWILLPLAIPVQPEPQKTYDLNLANLTTREKSVTAMRTGPQGAKRPQPQGDQRERDSPTRRHGTNRKRLPWLLRRLRRARHPAVGSRRLRPPAFLFRPNRQFGVCVTQF